MKSLINPINSEKIFAISLISTIVSGPLLAISFGSLLTNIGTNLRFLLTIIFALAIGLFMGLILNIFRILLLVYTKLYEKDK